MNWPTTLGDWLLHSLASTTVILCLGGLAARFCRQAVYQIRIIEWTLAGCLIIPLLQQWNAWPHIDVAVLPQTLTRATDSLDGAPSVAGDASGTHPSNRTAQWRLASRNELPGGWSVSPIRRTGAAADLENPSGPVTASALIAPASPPSQPFAEVPGERVWLIAGFLAVVAALATWLGIGMLRCRRLLRGAEPVPAEIADLFATIAGDRVRKVRLLVSDQIDSPITWGVLKPVVLLPRAFVHTANSAALRWGLAHEWSHIQRRDVLGLWLATAAKLVCFYQPVYWWLRRRLTLNQDYLADAFAASCGESPEDYATFLVSLARRRLHSSTSLALGIADQPSQLADRVRVLLDSTRQVQLRPRTTPMLAISVGALVCLGMLSRLQLTAAEPAPAAATADAAAAPASNASPAQPAPQPPAAPAADAAQPLPDPITYSGRVIDRATGAPLAGAKVNIYLSDSRDVDWPGGMTSHNTNDAGEYSFTLTPEQVARNLLYIEAEAFHPDYQPLGRGGYAHSMIVKNLQVGEPPFYSLIKLDRGRQVTGTVRTPAGEPAAGMRVLAYTKAQTAEQFDFERGAWQDVQTDAQGRFQFTVATPGGGVFWLYPRDFAPQAHVIPKENSDLGTVPLAEGRRVTGQVLNAQGEPVSGVWVEVRRDGDGDKVDEFLGSNAVANGIRRAARTNDQGRFELRPLPQGSYRLQVQPHGHEPSEEQDRRVWQQRTTLNDVFTAVEVTLTEGVPLEPLLIRAAPHVLVRGRFFNSQGEPRASHEQHLFGRMGADDFFYTTSTTPKQDGWFEFKAPHGLKDARINLSTNEHSALRWRLQHDAPLTFGHDINLGTLEGDIEGIEIIRYEAPLFLVRVVDEAGQQVTDYAPKVRYTAEPAGGRGRFVDGEDVHGERQPDGRWRSSQLLPDEEFTVTIEKEGYVSEPQTLTLPEKAVQELTFVLRRAP